MLQEVAGIENPLGSGRNPDQLENWIGTPPQRGQCSTFSQTAPPLNPTGTVGSGGLAAVVLSRVCPKGRDEGGPLTGSDRPPDNLAPGRGEERL